MSSTRTGSIRHIMQLKWICSMLPLEIIYIISESWSKLCSVCSDLEKVSLRLVLALPPLYTLHIELRVNLLPFAENVDFFYYRNQVSGQSVGMDVWTRGTHFNFIKNMLWRFQFISSRRVSLWVIREFMLKNDSLSVCTKSHQSSFPSTWNCSDALC